MTETIPDTFIKSAVGSLKRGRKVRRRLPDGGLLHIDRPLPFLVLFRHPAGKPDYATADFVKAEASYIIAKEEQTTELATLIKEITSAMSAKFGAFMILELFAAPSAAPDVPLFQVLGPEEALPATVNVLRQELEQIKIENVPVTVAISSNEPLLTGPLHLLSEDELKQMSCLMLGLELKPVYLNTATGNAYPLLLRTLRTHLSNAIKKAVFDFVRVQTTHHPTHFQALGRRAVVPAVWRIDKKLAAISDQFQFLMLVTPVNASEAWEQFCKSKFSKAPTFHYRLMPVDTDLLKRKLYNIPLEKVEDPTLGFLFRDKRHELDKMLTMLSDRNTPDFLYSSLQLFGGVDEQLLKVAEGILAALPEPEAKGDIPLIPVEEFAALAEQEIAFLKNQDATMQSGVEIRKDIVGLLVSKGKLYIGTDAQIPRDRAEALIQHEVGTHVLTYFNGKAQPLQQLYVGVPGYEELQEGLAVLSEYLVGGLNHDRLRLLAARVVAVHHLTKGCHFTDNFWRLKEEYKFDDDTAFDITMRVHRGGGLTKDAVYLRGLVHLLQHLKDGGELEPLLIGKIRQDYIPIVQELIYRRVLRPIPIKPRYLLDPAIQPKLDQLKTGITVFNLI
ncbi:flavohemoglobin expression-modulating QEGLA motif protein [Pontibacter beigongshangensis]|uniref:flavohemoglobin expression-modulating QEGLA motif protein n=1 Tax=Pontibacter beigongshangensis TaxID=2574733 RepID=UPI001650CA35|nr:tyrosine/phenylalanine carboxypeptidase domain-containing protein [Pontibacter beigongshangensis]